MTYSSTPDANALLSKLTFSADGLIPVIVQDAETKDVLMFAFANREAVSLTLETGYAHYFSRSRNRLWKKGEESGHLQTVHDVLTDCDEDVLIYQVSQEGCACHEGYRSCFFRDIAGNVILPRLKDPKDIYG
ncbi:phosphoribosyl-AMP cyclohydrolase [Methanocorpusculum sp.]|nr:phosphoribosyl-AMP cyclohydrolase [Methanocorpusculum sp.]MBO5430875.1 phosphoribosyl-AMP cyclohydrolase [Methanocorpusculum sp.]